MQNQQPDIVEAVLNMVRETLGVSILIPEVEKEIESRLREEWGGHEVYVKKVLSGLDERNHARALSIRARYNMVNRRELQEEFGIGRAQFYKILKGG